jgi:hypothetical protein
MAKYSLAKQRGFWRRAEDTAKDSTSRGRALEELVVYLFDKVPGVSIIGTNTLAAFQSEEIDIAVSNSRSKGGFVLLPNFFLIECKNYNHKVGSPQVAWFDWKVRARGMDFGLLIANKGVTGSLLERTSANDIISMALSEKRRLLVLNKEDITDVVDTQAFVELVERRLSELILNRAPF